MHWTNYKSTCTKLLEHVNSLLVQYDIFINENFILPKSLRLCIIRFEAEACMVRVGEETVHEDHQVLASIIKMCTRAEREEGAPQLKMVNANN